VLPVLLLHLNIVVYACAFWLTHPLLPYVSKELGADRVVFGYLQSSLELAQIVSRCGTVAACSRVRPMIPGPRLQSGGLLEEWLRRRNLGV
jgi:hypothetical protein